MTGIIDPALFGMPDATTTGVPAGTTLKAYTGPMTITTPGTVIEGMIIDGTLQVTAANVTIKNCVVQNYGWWGIDAENAANITVQNCDFTASASMDTNAAILGSGTFIGNDISHSENGIVLTDGASVVRDNYIHDLFDNFGDPHIDGISVQGGQNHVLIEHNTIESWDTSCIFIKNDFGPINDITVRNNLLYGDPDRGDPAATIYVYGPNTTNVSITNNYVEKGNWFYYATDNANPTISGNIEWNNKTDATPYPNSAPTLPSAPTIASFSNDSGVAGDGITNDSTLTLTGTAAANGTVKVFDGTTQIGTANAGSSGAWSYTTAALADGSHNLTAKATNSSGQTSAASSALAVKIDTTAPNAPTVAAPFNNASGGVNLTGTAEANSTVKVFDGTTQVGMATANSSGAWSLTTGPLASGGHSLTAKATDAAGNISLPSAALSVTIAPAAPAAPSPISFSSDSGVVGDGITNDSTLALAGTAAANSTVKIFDGGTQIGTVTADSSGSWDYITSVLTNATHVLTATATNTSGTTSAASAALAVTVDTIAPNAPVIASSAPASSNAFLLAGTAEANSSVEVFDGTNQVGAVTANSSGAWSFTTAALVAGNHSFTAKAMDVAGNTGVASAALTVTSTSPAGTTMESAGSTTLTDVGNNFFLYTSGSGPSLKYAGAAVTDGQFGGWTPIGAEKVAGGGYDVAMKDSSSGLYVVWGTDSSGNYVTNVIGGVAGSNAVLKSIETTFHQDLNGDGVIGFPTATTVIEASGSTSLTEVGNNYYLNSSGSGPSLKYAGAAVTDGQFGGWTPIGAEKVAGGGYDVAMKDSSSGLYVVWSTDSSGNYVTNAVGGVAGTSTALESIETTFHQDLNGDGTIGVPTTNAGDTSASAVGLTDVSKSSLGIVTLKGTADASSDIQILDGNNVVGTVTSANDGTWSFASSSAVSNTVHTYKAQELDSTGHVGASSGSAIVGSTGSDTLTSTAGNDLFVGKGSHDTFVFAPNFGNDVINDFSAGSQGHDVIQFSMSVFDSFASVLAHATQVGQDVVIAADATDSLTLKNVKLAALDQTDFHFA